jgi:hypothetical protein
MNIMIVQNFEVIADKFNAARICTEVISSSQNENSTTVSDKNM